MLRKILRGEYSYLLCCLALLGQEVFDVDLEGGELPGALLAVHRGGLGLGHAGDVYCWEVERRLRLLTRVGSFIPRLWLSGD